jgi:hypothetical protein
MQFSRRLFVSTSWPAQTKARQAASAGGIASLSRGACMEITSFFVLDYVSKCRVRLLAAVELAEPRMRTHELSFAVTSTTWQCSLKGAIACCSHFAHPIRPPKPGRRQ